VIPFLAAAALKLSPVGAFLKRIPRGVWIALAVVAILLLGTCAHKRSVTKFGNERYAAGKADEAARIEKKAKQLAAKAEALSIALRSKSDETNRRIAGDARAVLVRGPGKAACLNPSSSGTSGRVTTLGQTSPAMDQVPPGERVDLIALPFAPTIRLAEQHDLCLAEAATWREWHRLLVADWEKSGGNR